MDVQAANPATESPKPAKTRILDVRFIHPNVQPHDPVPPTRARSRSGFLPKANVPAASYV